MNFLLDENFPHAARQFLQNKGHVVSICTDDKSGLDDMRVFTMAQERKAIFLTTDRDFFHTVPWLFPRHCGVIVIALRQPNRQAILSRLQWVLAQTHLFPLNGKVLQLRDRTYRIRSGQSEE